MPALFCRRPRGSMRDGAGFVSVQAACLGGGRGIILVCPRQLTTLSTGHVFVLARNSGATQFVVAHQFLALEDRSVGNGSTIIMDGTVSIVKTRPSVSRVIGPSVSAVRRHPRPASTA